MLLFILFFCLFHHRNVVPTLKARGTRANAIRPDDYEEELYKHHEDDAVISHIYAGVCVFENIGRKRKRFEDSELSDASALDAFNIDQQNAVQDISSGGSEDLAGKSKLASKKK